MLKAGHVLHVDWWELLNKISRFEKFANTADDVDKAVSFTQLLEGEECDYPV